MKKSVIASVLALSLAITGLTALPVSANGLKAGTPATTTATTAKTPDKPVITGTPAVPKEVYLKHTMGNLEVLIPKKWVHEENLGMDYYYYDTTTFVFSSITEVPELNSTYLKNNRQELVDGLISGLTSDESITVQSSENLKVNGVEVTKINLTMTTDGITAAGQAYAFFSDSYVIALTFVQINGMTKDYQTYINTIVQNVKPAGTASQTAPAATTAPSAKQSPAATTSPATTTKAPAATTTPPATTAKPAVTTVTSGYRKVYITKSGKKYHYDSSCNGGTYFEDTNGISSRLQPCEKCVL